MKYCNETQVRVKSNADASACICNKVCVSQQLLVEEEGDYSGLQVHLK